MARPGLHYVVEVTPAPRGVDVVKTIWLSAIAARHRQAWHREMLDLGENLDFQRARYKHLLDPSVPLSDSEREALALHARLKGLRDSITGPLSTFVVTAQAVGVGDIISEGELHGITREPPTKRGVPGRIIPSPEGKPRERAAPTKELRTPNPPR